MSKILRKINEVITHPVSLAIARIMFFITFVLITRSAFAADILAGSDTDIKDTLAGTGRHYLLYIDGVAAALMFATRKNVVVLGSIFVITVFINLLLFLAK